jgi:outer membrane protein
VKNILYLFILTLIGGTNSNAFPEKNNGKIIEINWEQGLKLVTENNNELKSAQEAYNQTAEAEVAARSGFLPTLSGSLTASQALNTSLSSSSAQTDSASISLGQNIFSGFVDYFKFSQARLNTQAAKTTLQIAEAKIRSDYVQGIANYLFAKNSLELSQKIQERRKENLRIVQLRFSGGRENKGSVLLSEAYFEQAQYDFLLSKENLKIAESNLQTLIGIENDQSIQFNGKIPRTMPPETDSNFNKMITSLPDYRLAVSEESSAKDGVEIAKSSFYPSLDFTASVGKTDQAWDLNYDKWSTTLTLTIPFFNGGRDYSSYNSSVAKWQSTLQSRISTQGKLMTKLKQSYSDFVLSFNKMKVDEKFKAAALARAEIARSKYNNGLMTFEEWDLVESDLILRQKNVLTSERDSINSEAVWNQTLGVGVTK